MRRRCPLSLLLVLYSFHICLSSPSNSTVPCSFQGLCRNRGKQIKISRGLCRARVQTLLPAPISKWKSLSFPMRRLHLTVISLGAIKMWHNAGCGCICLAIISPATSATTRAGNHTQFFGVVPWANQSSGDRNFSLPHSQFHILFKHFCKLGSNSDAPLCRGT